MRAHYIIWLFLIIACRQKENTAAEKEETGNVEIVDSMYRDHKGTDCSMPDSLRTNCAEINLVYPSVKTENIALKTAVANWTNYFLSSVLLYTDDASKITGSTLKQAVHEFYKSHENYKGSAIYGAFTAKSSYKVLYHENDHITIEITGHTYQGGAHSSTTIAVATFNTQTGNKLAWKDIITDEKAFAVLAEKKVKEERAEVFADGFKFDDIFEFALPKNYGLTAEGIYMHYEDYEIFPYAYGRTVITIPFSELGQLKK